MTIRMVGPTPVEGHIQHLLSRYKEIALEKIEEHFGDISQSLTDDRMLAFWEHLEGRRDWNDVPQIEEYYGGLMVGANLQLQRWIEAPEPMIPIGVALDHLVRIGLLLGESVEQLKQRQREKETSGTVPAEVERKILRDIAMRAVSQRSDQQLKPGWQEHCRRAIESGTRIDRLSDLLDIPGYRAEVAKIQPATLRRWASEVGVVFKAGRPKKE